MVLMISWWLFTFIFFFISGNICERVYMSSLFVLKVYMICTGYYTHNYVLLRKYIYQLIIRYVLMKNTYIKWYYSIINLFLSLPGLKLYRRLQLEWIYIYPKIFYRYLFLVLLKLQLHISIFDEMKMHETYTFTSRYRSARGRVASIEDPRRDDRAFAPKFRTFPRLVRDLSLKNA